METEGGQTYEGRACVEGENVFVQEADGRTAMVGLGTVQALRNVSLSGAERFCLADGGEVRFCVFLKEATVETTLDETELRVELRL